MPVSLMRNGLTAEKSIFSQKPSLNVSRSRFDLSRLSVFTSDIGALIPVDLIPTLPNDDYDLNCQYKIDFRPLLVPTLTPYKVRVHYYYCPLSYLWDGAETFMSKGRSGNISLTIPSIDFGAASVPSAVGTPTQVGNNDIALGFDASGSRICTLTTGSLVDYLCGSIPYDIKDASKRYLPFCVGPSSSERNPGVSTGYKLSPTSVLPFLMYQKIYRSNYLDPNLMSNGTVESKCWFPDDIDSSHWRIDYTGSNLFSLGYGNDGFVPIGMDAPQLSNAVANFVPEPSLVGATGGDNCVNLLQLRYAMYTNDMFTTALPFMQRGVQTSLDLDLSDAKFNSVFSGDISKVQIQPGTDFVLKDFRYTNDNNTASVNLVQSDTTDLTKVGLQKYSNSGAPEEIGRLIRINGRVGSAGGMYVAPTGSVSTSVSGKTNIAFTAQTLRNLLAISVWQERNALTNGSYGQFIKVHFGTSPNNKWYEPVYIGGTSSVFNFNSVVQTAPASVGDKTTPLGNQTSMGSSSSSGSVGKFHSPDFGFIMAVMSIIPDTIYTQTTEHWQFDVNPSDFYFPEYEKLSYQPILNKQLAYFGDGAENDLFGYSNRYVYLKQRSSIARGRFALPYSLDNYYHSYVQSRIFTDTPKLSQRFVTVYPPNIDRSFLAYPGEPAFLVQFYSGVNAVRSLSYVSQPNTFGF
ncbi:MAG: major capsid protein [Microviridae sp.]|nr:MAG: major capsid protein [Microviridae sp.]